MRYKNLILRLLALVAIFPWLLIAIVHAQDITSIRENIVPLRSSRDDVEKAAMLKSEGVVLSKYETADATLEVYFAGSECDQHGWKVPGDRVVSYKVYPKVTFPVPKSVTSDSDFIQTVDDDGTAYFTNRTKGIEYAVRQDVEGVIFIRFTPAAADAALRCPGYPQYDPVTDHYSLYQAGTVKDVANWDSGLVYAGLAQVRDDVRLKGYIFVYCHPSRQSECRSVIKMIKTVADDVLRSSVSRVTIAFGGSRQKTEYEVFVIPEEYPAAAPRPRPAGG